MATWNKIVIKDMLVRSDRLQYVYSYSLWHVKDVHACKEKREKEYKILLFFLHELIVNYLGWA